MKVEQFIIKDENWKRPYLADNPSEWFKWKYGATKFHEDIEFVTNKGTEIILKWQKNEYRAFKKKTNEDMRLGAIMTENLIKYIKERY